MVITKYINQLQHCNEKSRTIQKEAVLTHSSQDLNWWQTQPEAFLFHCLASSQNTSIHAKLFVFTAFAPPEWISSVTPICESYFVIWGKKTLRGKHSSSNVLCLGLGFSLNAGLLGWPCTLIRCALWHCALSRKTRWNQVKPWRDGRLKAWGHEKPQQMAGKKLLSALTLVCSSVAFTVKFLLVSPYTSLDYISHKNWREDHIFSSHTV